MPKLFICYRREDDKYAAQMICQRLVAEYDSDSVVIDLDGVPLGVDFRDYLDDQISSCDVMLAVIGNRWLDVLDQRKGDRRDFVRIEIESALQRGIPIVPVLLDGASMPLEDELPSSLGELAYRNAAEVRAGKDLIAHLDRLIADLKYPLKADEEARADALERTPLNIHAGSGSPTWQEQESHNPRIVIAGGTFRMGSAENDPEAYYDEKPQRTVTVSSFSIQRHPVTNEEYRRFDARHEFGSDKERHPVIKVTWDEALAYSRWLGGSLPTEAQWEFAARGPEGRKYAWGDEAPTTDRANYANSHIGETTPVETYPRGATPEGVCDLAGNVWEWCADWHGSPTEHEQDNPTGPTRGAARVLRGGSFNDATRNLRAADRGRSPPDKRIGVAGFRVGWTGSKKA